MKIQVLKLTLINLFSSPGQSQGRAIVLLSALASALALVAVGVSKMLRFLL